MKDWATRISEAVTPEEKVQLHRARWRQWNNFIESLKSKCRQTDTVTIQREPYKITISADDPEYEFKTALLSKEIPESDRPWTKCTVTLNGRIYTVFDNSFGSLNSTSDLDIGVVSETTDILDKWKTLYRITKSMVRNIVFSVLGLQFLLRTWKT